MIYEWSGVEATTPSTCAYYEFKCRDGSCIDDRLLCDGRRDCPDGSDELDCGTRSSLLFADLWQRIFRCILLEFIP